MYCLQSRWKQEGKYLVYYGLRCVTQCPENALQFSCGSVLRWYLRKPRQTETVLYL